MKQFLHQGDIVKIEKITVPILVTSKDFLIRQEKLLVVQFFQAEQKEPYILR